MENKFLIVANWKSNNVLNWFVSVPDSLEVVVAPPYPILSKIDYPLCAQDVSQFEEGPFTGEVSAKLLKELGVKYCLVGHSERRKYFSETMEVIQKKVDECKKYGIIPIVCAQNFGEIVPAGLIMYEPQEAISTNGVYHPAQDINEVLTDWKAKLPEETKFLYGGSVNSENCKIIIEKCKIISGFVVGHASLKPQTFQEIINQCS